MTERRILLVCTHGYFGERIGEESEMIIGHMDDIRSFRCCLEMSIEDFNHLVEPTLKELPRDTICLVVFYLEEHQAIQWQCYPENIIIV